MTLSAWYEGHTDAPVIVATPAELDALLDDVAALDGPQLVQLLQDGDMAKPDLSVGFDGDRGVLRYAGKAEEFYSKGGTFPLPEYGEVMYYFATGEFEYPDDAEIPAADARKAAHEYLASGGERPTCVEWTREGPTP
ncbi:Imm1 family immunity protein [Amycolatopsis sp. NPDC059021]|uniref:Imm1 family immunity protein n=1 Tax=Amycolatopsis sp. NPDC059021 TaxID=3346704 RepID=UPI003670CD51